MPPVLYPLAHVDLLPEASTQPAITPRLAILHTNASPGPVTPSNLRAYMARSDVTVECHFDVGWNGDVWQFMPVNVRADCNVSANPFAVSIETQDNGGATLDVTPWTSAQVEAIVKLLIWLRDEWHVPMVRCPRWDGSGVGAHRDFPQWSASAHSCPGNARFAQVPDIIALAAMNTPPPPPAIEEPYVFDEFVKDDAASWQVWGIGVDVDGQWACPAAELGVAWELYNRPTLDVRPLASLQAHHRKPVFDAASSVAAVDANALAEAVASKLAQRLAS